VKNRKQAEIAKKPSAPVKAKDEDKKEAVATPAKKEAVAASKDTEGEDEEGKLPPEEFKIYDEKSKSLWQNVKPKVFVDEESTYEISYLGLTVGHINLVTKAPTKLAGEDVYHFWAGMKSARAYRFIYQLDDYLESFVRKSDFKPMKYTLIQRESKQNVDDLQIFDQEQNKTFHWYKRLKNGKETKREIEAPIPDYSTDSYFALHFVRGLPLNIGDIYEFPVVTRGKIWLLKSQVEKVEEIKVRGKWVNALRIKAETSFPGVLSKRGDIVFWFSNDDEKVLLKFSAKIKLGSIEGILVDHKPGKK
jgi:hypothetical protein